MIDLHQIVPWVLDIILWTGLISAGSLGLRPLWMEPWFWLTEVCFGILVVIALPIALTAETSKPLYFCLGLMGVMGLCWLIKRRFPSDPNADRKSVLARLFTFRLLDALLGH